MGRAGKYNAKKTVVDNITFDSAREAKRYGELKLLFHAGQIRNLEIQPELQFILNGKPIFKYRADFSYFDGPDRVWEDAKGFRTPVYRLKKKIIEAQYGIQVREV